MDVKVKLSTTQTWLEGICSGDTDKMTRLVMYIMSSCVPNTNQILKSEIYFDNTTRIKRNL